MTVRKISKFLRDTCGATALIFAMSAVPTVGAMGIALDYMRAGMAHSRLQAAVDSAALAAGASDNVNTSELIGLVKDYIRVNGAGLSGFTVKSITRSTNDNGDVVVTANGVMNTLVMRILGIDEVDINAQTRVARTIINRAEIAMVLDTTGSMAGSKLSTLQDAAKTLIDNSLKANEDSALPLVKIGIVPFAQYVNVGVSWRNASWISVPADSGTQTFHGCVGSRNYPDNVRDQNYDTNPVPGLMNITCPSEITNLTTDKDTLDSAVDALYASGYTYIGAGLMWGWRLVSPDAPFAKGIAYEDMDKQKLKTKKFVILMTDGENTRAPSYPKHDSTSNSLANNLTQEVCTNIKASNIQIFTVAFQVSDGTTLNMLQTCASSKNYAFNAQDSGALVMAFQSISNQISRLRLAE